MPLSKSPGHVAAPQLQLSPPLAQQHLHTTLTFLSQQPTCVSHEFSSLGNPHKVRAHTAGLTATSVCRLLLLLLLLMMMQWVLVVLQS